MVDISYWTTCTMTTNLKHLSIKRSHGNGWDRSTAVESSINMDKIARTLNGYKRGNGLSLSIRDLDGFLMDFFCGRCDDESSNFNYHYDCTFNNEFLYYFLLQLLSITLTLNNFNVINNRLSLILISFHSLRHTLSCYISSECKPTKFTLIQT